MKRYIVAMLVLLAVGVWAADELQVTTGWQYNKNSRKRLLTASVTLYDVAGNGVVENVQTVSTNAGGDALILGGVTTPGFAWFQNTDATNTVYVGCYDALTNLVNFLELRAGEKAVCWLATTAPRAMAVSNAVRLDYVISDR